MRRPIHIQLLLPMLAVVVLAIALVSIANAYWGMRQARQGQEENLRRVVAALREASFPLTENVLRQTASLSGAEFVLVDACGQQRHATLSLSPDQFSRLGHLPEIDDDDRFSEDSTIELGGRDYLSRRVALKARGAAADRLVVLYPKDRWWGVTRRAAYPAILAGVVAVLVAMAVTTLLAHRFVRPIHQLRRQVAAVAGGDFRPLPVAGRNDELGDLAASVNQMAEQLSRYEVEVRRSEQLRTLGQLGAGMAHQLRNAATGALMAVELHSEDCTDHNARESLDIAARQLKLMETYLQRFLAMGQSRPVVLEPVVLDAIIEEVVAMVRPACQHARIDLRFDRPHEPMQIRGAADSLGQLLSNLLLNAIEAAASDAPARGEVRVGLQRSHPDRVTLWVEDSGPGPAESTRETLFEPFVTEKPEGTGLGLFVARHVAHDHHGSIHWERGGQRTRFIVEFPAMEANAAS